jgi:hypothetical protein
VPFSLFRVGCARGVDRAAGLAALRVVGAMRLAVFCASGRSRAPAFVLRAAAAGASVFFWAGGPAAVPARARLALRSRLCCAAGAGLAASVFFLSSPSSRGSLGAAAAAAAAGFPVFVFCCGFPSASLAPLAGCGGRWAPALFFGFPCVAWAPAGSQLSLF